MPTVTPCRTDPGTICCRHTAPEEASDVALPRTPPPVPLTLPKLIAAALRGRARGFPAPNVAYVRMGDIVPDSESCVEDTAAAPPCGDSPASDNNAPSWILRGAKGACRGRPPLSPAGAVAAPKWWLELADPENGDVTPPRHDRGGVRARLSSDPSVVVRRSARAALTSRAAWARPAASSTA